MDVWCDGLMARGPLARCLVPRWTLYVDGGATAPPTLLSGAPYTTAQRSARATRMSPARMAQARARVDIVIRALSVASSIRRERRLG